MGRLRKVSHQDVPVVSSFDTADSFDEPFVPNDFAEHDSYQLSWVVIFVYCFHIFLIWFSYLFYFILFLFPGCLFLCRNYL